MFYCNGGLRLLSSWLLWPLSQQPSYCSSLLWLLPWFWLLCPQQHHWKPWTCHKDCHCHLCHPWAEGWPRMMMSLRSSNDTPRGIFPLQLLDCGSVVLHAGMGYQCRLSFHWTRHQRLCFVPWTGLLHGRRSNHSLGFHCPPSRPTCRLGTSRFQSVSWLGDVRNEWNFRGCDL